MSFYEIKLNSLENLIKGSYRKKVFVRLEGILNYCIRLKIN